MLVGFTRVPVSLLAMFVGRHGVLSCFVVAALVVLVRCFVMMVSGGGMMLRGVQMMFGSRMRCHNKFLSDNSGLRKARRPGRDDGLLATG